MNQFESLCKLASTEQWCWNLYCGTCGHSCFRYGFREIARGLRPGDPNWLVYEPFIAHSNAPEPLGPLPRKYSPIEKQTILTICLDADICAIARDCRFPDWLGYLGLVLEHMRTDSELYRELSARWALRLKDLAYDFSQSHSRLEEIAANPAMLLSIQDLGLIEKDLKHQRPGF
jgi:hypothetical protein